MTALTEDFNSPVEKLGQLLKSGQKLEIYSDYNGTLSNVTGTDKFNMHLLKFLIEEKKAGNDVKLISLNYDQDNIASVVKMNTMKSRSGVPADYLLPIEDKGEYRGRVLQVLFDDEDPKAAFGATAAVHLRPQDPAVKAFLEDYSQRGRDAAPLPPNHAMKP